MRTHRMRLLASDIAAKTPSVGMGLPNYVACSTSEPRKHLGLFLVSVLQAVSGRLVATISECPLAGFGRQEPVGRAVIPNECSRPLTRLFATGRYRASVARDQSRDGVNIRVLISDNADHHDASDDDCQYGQGHHRVTQAAQATHLH